MVRFFDKLKDSLSKNKVSVPPLGPSTTTPPASDTPASTSSDQRETAFAISGPATSVDESPSQMPSEITSEPSSPSVVVKRSSSVKLSRVRVRRAMRPRPVIRESQVIDRNEPEDTELPLESVSSPEQPEDSEKAVSSPESMELEEDLETTASNPESMELEEDLETTASNPESMELEEDAENPTSSAGHVIIRKPIVQKRRRNIRIVKPKVRVVH